MSKEKKPANLLVDRDIQSLEKANVEVKDFTLSGRKKK